MASKPKRLVRYSPRARADLAENYEHTTHQRGQAQAERYYDFLIDAAQRAADGELLSRRLEKFPNVRAVTAKWPQATYAHYIVFQEEDAGIYVLRVLHSAQDMPKHFE
jgi:plasmid stabilization system protein ParE